MKLADIQLHTANECLQNEKMYWDAHVKLTGISSRLLETTQPLNGVSDQVAIDGYAVEIEDMD